MGLRAALNLQAALPKISPASGGYGRYGGGGGLLPASPWADDSPLTRINFEDVFGSDFPLELLPVTRAEAMSVPAVAAARHRICSTLARLPMEAYLGRSETVWSGSPADLLDHPDPAVPQFRTMVQTLDDVLFDGNAYWAVTALSGRTGLPVQITYVPLPMVQVDVDGVVTISTDYTDWLYRTQGRTIIGNTGRTPRPQVIWFAGPHEGLLHFGSRTIRSSVAMDRAAGRAADNPVPSIELHQTNDAEMTDGEIQAMLRSWMSARRGENGGVGYTSAGVEARALGQQPEQLLVEGRNQQAVEVARLAGIPAASIDASLPGTALTYANLLDRLRDLVDFGLQPYASAVTGRLSMDDCLPHGVSARFNFEPLTGPAPLAAAQTPATEGKP